MNAFDHGPRQRLRGLDGGLGRALGLGLVLLLAACSTSKSIARVREAPEAAGLHLLLRAAPEVVASEVAGLLRELGYREVSVERRADGQVQVLGAKVFGWHHVAHGVRLIVAPDPGGGSYVRSLVARRIKTDGIEDLAASREALVRALRGRFGGET